MLVADFEPRINRTPRMGEPPPPRGVLTSIKGMRGSWGDMRGFRGGLIIEDGSREARAIILQVAG